MPTAAIPIFSPCRSKNPLIPPCPFNFPAMRCSRYCRYGQCLCSLLFSILFEPFVLLTCQRRRSGGGRRFFEQLEVWLVEDVDRALNDNVYDVRLRREVLDCRGVGKKIRRATHPASAASFEATPAAAH